MQCTVVSRYSIYIYCSWIDLSNASSTDLNLLSLACQPATFGLGQTDVLDENYRKALKLDTSDFSINFSLETSGLLDIVRSSLVVGYDENTKIKGELYKLNVYGEPMPPGKPSPLDSDTFLTYPSLILLFHRKGFFLQVTQRHTAFGRHVRFSGCVLPHTSRRWFPYPTAQRRGVDFRRFQASL
jgi:hypothetical protein